MSFNTSSGDSVEMSDQLVAGIATNDFWLGFFPLSPIAMNFTDMDQSVPSLLASLIDQARIPSPSWAYSAGAYYQNPPAFASLALGGFDELKIGGWSLEVPFGADQSRDLVVWLDSITYDTYGSSALLTQGVYMFIDSMGPHLWLPPAVCHRFEQAFNLTWNNDTELYLLDEAVHTALVEQNPTFTFSLGESEDQKDLITITIPYAAFDLKVSAPVISNSSRYFPLKRAADDGQYILGRVFLQEAYIIADYERRNFSVSQAAFLHDSSASQIIDIEPPARASNSTDEARTDEGPAKGLSPGAIAGVVLGGIVLLEITVLLFFWHRKRLTRGAYAITSEVIDDDAADSMKRAGSENFLSEMAVHEQAVHEVGCEFGATPELQDLGENVGMHEL